ncbi:unnamed protein product [Fusarium graminearum]|nr:unnamed protein product [Fusarium graminearum]
MSPNRSRQNLRISWDLAGTWDGYCTGSLRRAPLTCYYNIEGADLWIRSKWDTALVSEEDAH